MGKFMSKVQKRMGRKAIVPNAKKKLIDTGRALDEFYDVKRVPFEVKRKIEDAAEEEEKGKGKLGGRGKAKGTDAKAQQKGRKSGKGPKKKARGGRVKTETVWKEKDIVFPKDTSALIQHGIRERGLDPTKAIVRINMDFGQEFLKCTASIFDPSTPVPDLVDSDNEDDDEEEDFPDLLDSDDDVDKEGNVDDDDDDYVDDEDDDDDDDDDEDDVDNDDDDDDDDDINDVDDDSEDASDIVKGKDVNDDVIEGLDVESSMIVDSDNDADVDYDDVEDQDEDFVLPDRHRVHFKNKNRANASETKKDRAETLNSG